MLLAFVLGCVMHTVNSGYEYDLDRPVMGHYDRYGHWVAGNLPRRTVTYYPPPYYYAGYSGYNNHNHCDHRHNPRRRCNCRGHGR
jgi:hypothetical protein